MNNHYFTFGSSEYYPYCRGYVIVKAENMHEALEKFNARFPPRNDITCNCAFYYAESQWKKITVDMGVCHEIIE